MPGKDEDAMNLKLLDEYEKETIFDKGLKPGVVRHDARFEFALWLEKRVAQQKCPNCGANFIPWDEVLNPDLCAICGKPRR
jgi:hypothetical protein